MLKYTIFSESHTWTWWTWSMEKSLLKQTFNIGTDDNCIISWLDGFAACKPPRSASSVPVGDCDTENQTQVWLIHKEECHWNFDDNFIECEMILEIMAIFTILTQPIQKHGMSFHLLVSSSISFFSVLQFSLKRSFTYSKVFYFLWGYGEWHCFPDFFLSMLVIDI
jgi:hypothetical protein